MSESNSQSVRDFYFRRRTHEGGLGVLFFQKAFMFF